MAEGGGRPRVSVIIVVLDGERFLGEAIDSVRAQTFEDWELIVVDDGSTDGTLALAAARQAEEPGRFRLLRHPNGENRGIAASRNLGLLHARGEFIAFLDADDVFLPTKLADQVPILDADPALCMVYGRTLIWTSWAGGDPSADFTYDLGVEPDRRHDPPVLFRLLMENEAQSPTVCNAMLRADMVRRVGGFEPEFRTMFEDMTCFARLLAVHPAHVSSRTWALYRQHGESTSARSSAEGRDDRLRLVFLRWLAGAVRPLRPPPGVAAAIGRERRRLRRRELRRLLSGLKRRVLG